MMSTLQKQLVRLKERLGPDSPSVQMLQDQIAAEKTGKSAQDLYLTGSVKGLETDSSKPA